MFFILTQTELPDIVELPAQLAGVLGILAPLAIQIINKFISSKTARLVISYVLSGLTGVVAASMSGYLGFASLEDLAVLVFAVIGFTQLSFKFVWNPLIFGTSNGLNSVFKFFNDGDK